MNRLALAIVSGVAVFIAVYSVASAMGLTSHNLAAGDVSVAACDDNGPGGDSLFTIDGFTLDGGGKITQVAIGDIDSDCTGGQLTIHLTRADQTSAGSGGPVAVTGASMTVAISGAPDPHDVKHEVIVIVGP